MEVESVDEEKPEQEAARYDIDFGRDVIEEKRDSVQRRERYDCDIFVWVSTDYHILWNASPFRKSRDDGHGRNKCNDTARKVNLQPMGGI